MKAQLFVVSSLLWILIGADSPVRLSYNVLDRKHRYTKAKHACNEFQKDSFLPNDDSNMEEVIQELHRSGVTSVWMAIERKPMTDWMWIDNTCLKMTLDTRKEGAHRCAVIDQLKTDLYTPYSCYSNTVCYMCNISACDYSNHAFLHCFKQGHYMLAVASPTTSWFKARKICQRTGGDLAKIDNKEKKNDIFDSIHAVKSKLQLQRCQKLYIGLRRDRWMNVMPTGAEEPVRQDLLIDEEWAMDDCVELTITGRNQTRLKTADCSNYETSVLCIYAGDTLTKVLNKTGNCADRVSIEEIDSCRKRNIITVSTFGVLFPGVVVAALAIIIYMYSKRKRRKRTAATDNLSQNAQPSSEEQILTNST